MTFLISWGFTSPNDGNKERVILKDIKAPKLLSFLLRPKNEPKSILGVILFCIAGLPGVIIFPLCVVLYFFYPDLVKAFLSFWFFGFYWLLIVFLVIDVIVGSIIDSIYRRIKGLDVKANGKIGYEEKHNE